MLTANRCFHVLCLNIVIVSISLKMDVFLKSWSSQATLKLTVLLWGSQMATSHDLKVNVYGLQGSGIVHKLTFDGNGSISHIQADMGREERKQQCYPGAQQNKQGRDSFLKTSLLYIFFLVWPQGKTNISTRKVLFFNVPLAAVSVWCLLAHKPVCMWMDRWMR